MEQTVRFKLNRRPVSITTDGERALLWVLRTDLKLTGVKYGCGRQQCGACTVIVNKEAVRSCHYPVKNVSGKEVITIEGLAQNETLHPIQKAFIDYGAVQCGFCTPGMILEAYSLLLKNPRMTRKQIIQGMEAHLCRCSTYTRIIEAIQAAATELQKGGKA